MAAPQAALDAPLSEKQQSSVVSRGSVDSVEHKKGQNTQDGQTLPPADSSHVSQSDHGTLTANNPDGEFDLEKLVEQMIQGYVFKGTAEHGALKLT